MPLQKNETTIGISVGRLPCSRKRGYRLKSLTRWCCTTACQRIPNNERRPPAYGENHRSVGIWFTKRMKCCSLIFPLQTVVKYGICHILTSFLDFSCCLVYPIWIHFPERKKSPENLTDLVRPSGLFLYFLCFIRAWGYTFPANFDVNSIKIK